MTTGSVVVPALDALPTTSGHRSPTAGSRNRISQPKYRRIPPPAGLDAIVSGSPYVQRVDLHTNGFLVVTGAEHGGSAPARRGEGQPAVERNPDQHPDRRAVGAGTRGSARA